MAKFKYCQGCPEYKSATDANKPCLRMGSWQSPCMFREGAVNQQALREQQRGLAMIDCRENECHGAYYDPPCLKPGRGDWHTGPSQASG
jgi:hypothetical protein